MKSTLKQIAEKTGFSISTVSRSLSNSSKISELTRSKVHQAAQELGYRAIPKKRRVRKKNKQLHFALLSDFRNGEFYAKFFCGYREASYLENVRVSLMSVQNQRNECVKSVQRVHRDNNYDGIILFFPALERRHYAHILEVLPQDYPIISNALIENPNVTTITFDGYSGGHLAAAHLHHQGYRKLGIIEGPKIKPEARFRYNGFMDYVHQHKELELTWRYDGDYEFESGVKAFKNFRKLSSFEVDIEENPHGSGASDAPSTSGRRQGIAEAVFATNDSMSAGFMESAKDAGLTIPDDVAILGYDNLPTCVHRKPLMSSINTDFVDLACSSIKTLKNKISNQGHQAGTLSLINVDIAERESTVSGS